MKPKQVFWILPVFALLCFTSCSSSPEAKVGKPLKGKSSANELAQVPSWSQADLDFFLHGSMSTEVVPENVLRAFIRIYPDLFPTTNLTHLGLIADPKFGWPIGFSRKEVPHLGGLSSLGVNCAACHVGEVTSPGKTTRVLGGTSQFDAEAFFGSVIVATFRTSDPTNMKKFLPAYVIATRKIEDPRTQFVVQSTCDIKWAQQQEAILKIIQDDPFGAKDVAAGTLHPLTPQEFAVELAEVSTVDLAVKSRSVLKLFHNMRAALHVPDQPPDKAPPASGPGRNDAFGLLSAALFGVPQPFAPVKYGLVWNVENRQWVHWDGNTRSPLGRNLLASLGLGAPLVGHHGELDFALVKRQTDLSERIRSPRYPFAIDSAAARRGARLYQAQCGKCHDGPEGNNRLYDRTEIGSDPTRAEAFTPESAARFNKFLAELETPGYQAGSEPGIRSTQKYSAPSMAGVWARSPYLHNGSVRTMQELLSPPAMRAKAFHRGSRVYDSVRMGYADEGGYLLDTAMPGNANTGHTYGTDLSVEQKHDLIEHLKTL